MELPAAADMHVHLRQGPMMELVVPEIRKGGVNTVFVMVDTPISHCLVIAVSLIHIQPNLTPPITTVKQALEYKSQLQALEPNVTFLMSLYLHIRPTPHVCKSQVS